MILSKDRNSDKILKVRHEDRYQSGRLLNWFCGFLLKLDSTKMKRDVQGQSSWIRELIGIKFKFGQKGDPLTHPSIHLLTCLSKWLLIQQPSWTIQHRIVNKFNHLASFLETQFCWYWRLGRYIGGTHIPIKNLYKLYTPQKNLGPLLLISSSGAE